MPDFIIETHAHVMFGEPILINISIYKFWNEYDAIYSMLGFRANTYNNVTISSYRRILKLQLNNLEKERNNYYADGIHRGEQESGSRSPDEI